MDDVSFIGNLAPGAEIVDVWPVPEGEFRGQVEDIRIYIVPIGELHPELVVSQGGVVVRCEVENKAVDARVVIISCDV